MKSKPCKYCKGTGKTLIKDEKNTETKYSGLIFGGRDINQPCIKCNGTGRRIK